MVQAQLHLAANIPPYRMQERTAYGGLTCGLALAAAQRQISDLPPLRSMVVNFTGPVGETPEFDVRLLRLDTRLTGSSGGYASQHMRIWNSAGDQVAEGLQSVAVVI